WVSERADLHSSPAIRAAGRALFELAGAGIDDVAHVDLYSCFPSAVQIGAAELGLGLAEPDRPLTVTGGLSFAGGPGNNYSTHAIAAMVGRLRAYPAARGRIPPRPAPGRGRCPPPPRAGGRARGVGHDRLLHGDARARRIAGAGSRRLPAPRRATGVGQRARAGDDEGNDPRGVLRPP